MTQIPESRPALVSVHHVALMRPELPGLIAEILAEITACVPGYSQLRDGPYGGLMRQCVQRNVATFVARIADPGAASPERDELCRTVGEIEALNGHSMDRLQSAYRIGVQVAWRRWVKVAKRHSVPTPVVSALADALFSYVDEMTSLSRVGHAEGRMRSGRRVEEQRGRLLARLVADPPASLGVLADLAAQAAWPLPEEATPVVVEPGGAAPLDRTALDADVLADLADPRPHLLIPGPITQDRADMLARFLGPARAVMGLTVPLTEVSHSVRWARQTFAMAPQAEAEAEADTDADTNTGTGTGTGTSANTDAKANAGPVRSEDHLLGLWLRADPALTRRIADRQLAPLRGFSPSRRARLTDTLLAWFSTRGNVEQMAKMLELHPQTVRYRMRALDKVLGPLLEDPEWRLATELVLRQQDPDPV